MQIQRDLLKECNIPSIFWELQHSTYFGSAGALRAAATYAEKFDLAKENGTDLVIHGPPRSLKSFLASYVCRILLAHGRYSVYWANPDDLVDSMFKRDDAPKPFRARFQVPNLLVIDDLNQPMHSSLAMAVSKAVAVRKDRQRPICFVTHLDTDRFIESYGSELHRRLDCAVQIHTKDDEVAQMMEAHSQDCINQLTPRIKC